LIHTLPLHGMACYMDASVGGNERELICSLLLFAQRFAFVVFLLLCRLYPPSAAPPGINYVKGKNSVSYNSPKPFRWYIETYPFLTQEERPIELIQEPGEIIFVPAGWWHTVLNVTDTVAVTQVFLLFSFNDVLLLSDLLL
jgi:hypothetical protein